MAAPNETSRHFQTVYWNELVYAWMESHHFTKRSEMPISKLLSHVIFNDCAFIKEKAYGD